MNSVVMQGDTDTSLVQSSNSWNNEKVSYFRDFKYTVERNYLELNELTIEHACM